MANIKVTSSNIEKIITDMVNDVENSRTNNFYFVSNELNETTIRQMAWDKNIIINVESVNGYNSKFVFFEILA